MTLKGLVASSFAAALLLTGCSSPAEKMRGAANGCMGGLDAPGLYLSNENDNVGLAIWSKGASMDDAECVMNRLEAPSRVVTKVRDLAAKNNAGYTEWSDYRIRVEKGPVVVFEKAVK
jgi:hypothetical protein